MTSLEDIQRLSELNYTVVEISKELGISVTAIYALPGKSDWKKPRPCILSEEDKILAKEMLAAGYKRKKICEKFNITYPTLKHIIGT